MGDSRLCVGASRSSSGFADSSLGSALRLLLRADLGKRDISEGWLLELGRRDWVYVRIDGF